MGNPASYLSRTEGKIKEIVIRDQALIREGKISAIAADDDMVEDLQPHQFRRKDKLLGYFPIAQGRLRIAGRMIMEEYQRGRVGQ
jgi:hypothetical protein